MQRLNSRKVLLIGWDAADWKIINPLLDSGKMPNLERLINTGVMGNLATLFPELSPMLWTSIATGKRPFKHGIYGFTEPSPQTGYIRPITNLSRKTKAIWNILSQEGLKSIVIGWWPSHPVEPIDGVMVSNHYQQIAGNLDQPWPMRPGTVHPTRIERNLAALRFHPQQMDAGHILPFVPHLDRIDQDKDHRLESIAKIISEVTSIQNAALAVMHHEPWDFTAVYFDGIDHFCHGFINYHPPHQPQISEEDFEIYKDVVCSGYILHDIYLGQLVEKTTEDTTVILVSDHGFHSDHLRPRSIPNEPAGPAAQHRDYGIVVMKGPGIKADERVYGASLLDICPTILTLFGLPVAKDMDGTPLVSAFHQPPRFEIIDSWDTVPGAAGMHPPNVQLNAQEAQEALNQLVALGYIEKPSDDRETAMRETVRELDYNLARSYIDANRHADAIPYFEKLCAEWPEESRFGIQLTTCCQSIGQIGRAREVLEETLRRKEQDMEKARDELAQFQEEHKERKPEEWSEKEKRQFRQLRSRSQINPATTAMLVGDQLVAEENLADALKQYQEASAMAPFNISIHLRMGSLCVKDQRWKEAEQHYTQTLALDPENATAHQGLCRCFVQQRRFAEAASSALDCLALQFFNPFSHYLLGIALARLGNTAQAVEAFETAITQNPNFPDAHRRLARLYKRRIKDTAKAEKHLRLAKEADVRIKTLEQTVNIALHTLADPPVPEEDTGESPDQVYAIHEDQPWDRSQGIVIVSGLPRSGTSMMMQALAVGGIPPFTDAERQADEDNPRGYYEHEKVKSLQHDASWLPDALGHALKVIAQLLPSLPAGLSLRVIFMERSIQEILRSQQAMLSRSGEEGSHLSPERLAAIYSKQLAESKKMLEQRGIPTLVVPYKQAVENPVPVFAQVNTFLGGQLNQDAMSKTVDQTLYRQKLRHAK